MSVTCGSPVVIVPVLSRGDGLNAGQLLDDDAALDQHALPRAGAQGSHQVIGMEMTSAHGAAATMKTVARVIQVPHSAPRSSGGERQ